MFHLLASLRSELLAWLVLSRAGRERMADALGLDASDPTRLIDPVPVDETRVAPRKGRVTR